MAGNYPRDFLNAGLVHVSGRIFRDRGVGMSYLNWGNRIRNICRKANKTISFLKRNLNNSSVQLRKRHIRPLLDHIWVCKMFVGPSP